MIRPWQRHRDTKTVVKKTARGGPLLFNVFGVVLVGAAAAWIRNVTRLRESNGDGNKGDYVPPQILPSNHPKRAPGDMNSRRNTGKPATRSSKLGPDRGEKQPGSREYIPSIQLHIETGEAVTVAQGAADPETLSGGGEVGTVTGDRQAVGEVPAVMDQAEATPDFHQQRDG
jgi:hypothetical protein